jgi:NADH dehydrogenase
MLKRITLGIATLGGAYTLSRWLSGVAPRAGARGHVTQTADEYRAVKHRILILGAGFGGIAAALRLDKLAGSREDTSVLIVDDDNSLLFTPLLWTVADGRVNPNHVVIPIRSLQRGRSFHVLQAEVQRIDLQRREVHTTAGPRPYDKLVIALGSVTAVPDLPGLREHAARFHTPADAMNLRNRLIDSVEAAHNTEDPAERRARLTFVVGGGGDTGIELAATIHDYLHSGLLKEYPWLGREPVRIVVAGRADRLVPMSTRRTSEAVRRVLEDQGIEVMTGASIEGVEPGCVHTSLGDIPSHTLFWAAGISAPPVVREVEAEHAKNGALLVDDHLRVKDHPDVYAVGDSAWAFDAETGAPAPPTAQAAEHQGKYVADSIASELGGEPAQRFRFSPLGHLSLLGKRTGVAQIGPLVFSGLPAWFIWHGYYILHIPSWRNRIRIGADLLLAALTSRETSQLRLEPGERTGR